MKTSLNISTAAVFVWIGFIGAISFMEAWLKFQAPGVSLPIGLGIGKLVFGALNKVEWFLAIIFFLCLIRIKLYKNYWFYGVLFILFIQTIWILPELNSRADAIISGVDLPSSPLHFYYVGAEIIKLILLITIGIKLLKLER
ncbi:hypothetical protein [Moheibacter lacus]|uniref:DUF4149 domain-containing protein n=1 Tax=Moheibacter lacus TaxID=2745851 RepID=A0A838ZMQ9_9FLAO|nr:hypothetical protein [Moheibacter lacus]MBA5628377.1 hypothetical protein [Moheibacter lacus]